MVMADFYKTVESDDAFVKVKDLPGNNGAQLCRYQNGLQVVVKVIDAKTLTGKTTQRGLPVIDGGRHSLAYRRLAEMFGWEYLVPKIVLKTIKGKQTSIQQYVTALSCRDLDDALVEGADVAKKLWIKRLLHVTDLVSREEWLKLCLLDMLACSRDRHINNVGFRMSGTNENGEATYGLVAWDNDASFGLTFERYYCVFHKYIFPKRMPIFLRDHIDMFSELEYGFFVEKLTEYLTTDEIRDVWLRMQWVVRYPYKMPYKVMSKGAKRPTEFPSYGSFFKFGALVEQINLTL